MAKETMNVAGIGPNADDKSVLLGNYAGIPSHYSTILNGIQHAAKGKVLYAKGSMIADNDTNYWKVRPLREAIIMAKKSDVVIMCMGLNPSMEGEEGDDYNGCHSGDKADIEFPPCQIELLKEIVAVGKPVIFLNISGSCMNLSLANELCDAVVQVFYPGAEGGEAVADILYGKICKIAGI